ncbi:excalibur calcium-binding domain-containing protein [Tateyamaria sp. ANG-S1]|uniref:excalibur calcium-binding domain-containing protein n=1 Tax=Tateyamaria sp. ANG-S1 TaxID=1577905 RepID=UPI00057C654B|nr:excalibur calcium-binding domain-containing protein [Tateyamaria sp. ANG-S1]KIC51415.1 hypothetical protein RA29_02625 [Tateyamaria sp. ANG-S1]
MMNFRSFLMLGAVAGLAACQPAIPDSNPGDFADPGRGVGFENPNTLEARQSRDAQLTGPAVQAAPAVGTQPLPPTSQAQAARQTPRAVSNPASLDAELAQIAAANDAAAAQANSGQAVVNASPSNAAPVILNNPGISDENDFDAVSSRQSIESDAARLEANRQQYQVVQPTALPSRAESAQPNVVQYALQTRHPKGTRVHRRFGVGSAARFERNCAAYNSADEAQIDFLARGGPERDRQGLDPDGDGYACAWDPAPFRRAAGN